MTMMMVMVVLAGRGSVDYALLVRLLMFILLYKLKLVLARSTSTSKILLTSPSLLSTRRRRGDGGEYPLSPHRVVLVDLWDNILYIQKNSCEII